MSCRLLYADAYFALKPLHMAGQQHTWSRCGAQTDLLLGAHGGPLSPGATDRLSPKGSRSATSEAAAVSFSRYQVVQGWSFELGCRTDSGGCVQSNKTRVCGVRVSRRLGELDCCKCCCEARDARSFHLLQFRGRTLQLRDQLRSKSVTCRLRLQLMLTEGIRSQGAVSSRAVRC
jgi:hypothetical protein